MCDTRDWPWIGPPVRLRGQYRRVRGESLTRRATAPFRPRFVASPGTVGAFLQHLGGASPAAYQRWIAQGFAAAQLFDSSGRRCARHAGEGRAKQMGPALLPTPLSPMRGHVRRRELGIRCFPVRPSEETRLVLSPALAPASESTLCPVRFRRAAPEGARSFQPVRPSTGGPVTWPSLVVGVLERTHRRIPVRRPSRVSDASFAHPTGLPGPFQNYSAAPSSTGLAFGVNLPQSGLLNYVDRSCHVFPV